MQETKNSGGARVSEKGAVSMLDFHGMAIALNSCTRCLAPCASAGRFCSVFRWGGGVAEPNRQGVAVPFWGVPGPIAIKNHGI